MQQVLVSDIDYYAQTWDSMLQNLKIRYGDSVYRNWISKLNFKDHDNGIITISAPSRFVCDWVNNNYINTITQLWQYSDENILKIELICESDAPSRINSYFKKEEDKDNINNNYITNQSVIGNIAYSLDQDNLYLDSRFTLDSFIVGQSNQLAFAAAQAIAYNKKSAQAEMNPLFLYGGVGLGKTHLMHAIAWHIKKETPERRVVYMSAEKFMYQFVKAIRNRDIIAFKEQFRSVDVLMIDDVQFICGKESTQEEFFHTFNALIDNNRQIVLSCDRSPSDLSDLEERVRSRLGWGLVVDIHSTDYELRLGILQSKIEQLSIKIPQKVLEFLANKITSNIRELEGALNKVVAYSTLVGKDVTVEITQEILRDLIRSNEKAISIDDIQKKVAEFFNIKIADMVSTRRLRNIARPRQIAMYLSKELTIRSLAEIGKKFGGKDHTTVMHAVKNIKKLLDNDKELQDNLRVLTRSLQNF
jgi:chromosomal replication initiator protein